MRMRPLNGTVAGEPRCLSSPATIVSVLNEDVFGTGLDCVGSLSRKSISCCLQASRRDRRSRGPSDGPWQSVLGWIVVSGHGTRVMGRRGRFSSMSLDNTDSLCCSR